MSKRPVITEPIRMEKLIPGGQALGTLADGRKVMVWGALPGELVTALQVDKQKSHYLTGVALEYTEPASARIAPQDECFLSTSPWQILQYDYELAQKSELLREVFRQNKILFADDLTALIDATRLNVAPAPVWTNGREFSYRNKMEYALYFSHEDEQIHLAFHARGSHRKVPIRQSSLEIPAIFAQATKIVAELNSKGAEAREFQSLLLRSNQQGVVSGGLFEKHKPHPVFTNLSDTLLNQPYSYSPNGFFQINLPVYEQALRIIQQHIDTAKVLDLYAGVGTIGLSVARDRNLTLVECDRSAYRELEHNVAASGTPAQPVLAKSEEVLDFIQPNQTIIVDPPRAGCHPELLERILAVQPAKVIYLSCNPATQARDAKILLDHYDIAEITPFNFFPRTPHLENLIIFTHRA